MVPFLGTWTNALRMKKGTGLKQGRLTDGNSPLKWSLCLKIHKKLPLFDGVKHRSRTWVFWLSQILVSTCQSFLILDILEDVKWYFIVVLSSWAVGVHCMKVVCVTRLLICVSRGEHWLDFDTVILVAHYLPQYFIKIHLPHSPIDLIKNWQPRAG